MLVARASRDVQRVVARSFLDNLKRRGNAGFTLVLTVGTSPLVLMRNRGLPMTSASNVALSPLSIARFNRFISTRGTARNATPGSDAKPQCVAITGLPQATNCDASRALLKRLIRAPERGGHLLQYALREMRVSPTRIAVQDAWIHLELSPVHFWQIWTLLLTMRM